MTAPISRPIRNRNVSCLRGRALWDQPAAAVCVFVAASEDSVPADTAFTPDQKGAVESADDVRVIEPELPLVLDPRFIRFKSARSSAALWQRRSASFSRHF